MEDKNKKGEVHIMNGGNIRELRQKKGMSLDRLSELSGVSKSYLSYIERGLQTNPSISVLEKMSQALGIELLYLIQIINEDSEGQGEKHPTSM